MLKRILAAATVISCVIICGLLVMTTPSESGPLGILAFFVFMYLAALGVLTFLFYGISLFIAKATVTITRKPAIGRLAFRKAYYYASAAALAPVMLIAMQSVNQIGVYQFLLVLLFVMMAWVYIAKRTI